MDLQTLENLISQNKSTREVARILGRKPSAVSYWLKKHGLRTNFTPQFKTSGNISNPRKCRICETLLNESNDSLGRGNICRACKSKIDVERKKEKKRKAIRYKGGGCNVCGYDKSFSALEFHHIDPSSKEKEPHLLNSLSWDKQKEELDKCILLCANCHREVHDRLRVDDKFNVLDWVSDPDSRYN